MTNGLRERFPMIRSREEVISEIESRRELFAVYSVWEEEQQKLFLDYCTGVRGIKLLYDQFLKAFINPDVTPESSLLILDIVVQLEDGSIANVEAQKIGYSMPGQRSACYSADLLLRQYKRVKGEKGEKGKKFSYRDIQKVYTIIFFEKSTKEFHEFPDIYIHKMKQVADTGLVLNLLQEYVFIPLDIFRRKLDNEGVNSDNKLEAWFTFLYPKGIP